MVALLKLAAGHTALPCSRWHLGSFFGFKRPVKPFSATDHHDLYLPASLTLNNKKVGWKSLISSFPESSGLLMQIHFLPSGQICTARSQQVPPAQLHLPLCSRLQHQGPSYFPRPESDSSQSKDCLLTFKVTFRHEIRTQVTEIQTQLYTFPNTSGLKQHETSCLFRHFTHLSVNRTHIQEFAQEHLILQPAPNWLLQISTRGDSFEIRV